MCIGLASGGTQGNIPYPPSGYKSPFERIVARNDLTPLPLHAIIPTYSENNMKLEAQQRKLLPSVEYLHEAYSYDPITGELRWKQRPLNHFTSEGAQQYFNDNYAGKLVGVRHAEKGLRIKVKNETYVLQRVIWKLHTGEEPPFIVDHQDGDFCNNRWLNLRAATSQQNAWNTERRGYSVTKTGKYRVRVSIDFGTFDTAKEAQAKYKEVASNYQGAFFRLIEDREDGGGK